jgi:hypothetical protein
MGEEVRQGNLMHFRKEKKKESNKNYKAPKAEQQ